MSQMSDSILNTIKKTLGLEADYDAFDTEIIVFINSAMMTLQQLGIGPTRGFIITNSEQTWSDFLQTDKMLEGVKHYIYLCVRMVFDPPGSSFVMDSMKQQKEELEWRLREQSEYFPGEEDASQDSETTTDVVYADGGFRAHGGRYASDPDFPWVDGPAQPAITDS